METLALCAELYLETFGGCMISHIASIITPMVIDLTARHNYLEHNNTAIQCIFTDSEENGTLSSAFDIKWIILPHLLNSLSLINLVTFYLLPKSLFYEGSSLGYYVWWRSAIPYDGIWNIAAIYKPVSSMGNRNHQL